MANTKKVASLIEEKRKITKEIEEIQRSCKHPTKSIKNVRERLDSQTMVVRWTCDTCFSIVGIPSDNELQNYLKQ